LWPSSCSGCGSRFAGEASQTYCAARVASPAPEDPTSARSEQPAQDPPRCFCVHPEAELAGRSVRVALVVAHRRRRQRLQTPAVRIDREVVADDAEVVLLDDALHLDRRPDGNSEAGLYEIEE